MTATMPEYEGWLARGGFVRIRSARPEDRAEVREMHQRLSIRSIYLRYFTCGINLERTLERLLRPADDGHETLVTLIDDRIVAVACYERVGVDDSAEVAFLVDDEHHGLGIATLLLAELALVAQGRGIRRFVAVTLPSNTAMLSVFRDCGWSYSVTHNRDGVRIVVPLHSDARPGLHWGGAVNAVLNPPLQRIRRRTPS
jgi:GNAT superfamily N-acetyltransferase